MRSLVVVLVFVALAAGCASTGGSNAGSGVPTETLVTEAVPPTEGGVPLEGRVLDQATATGQNRSILRVQLDKTEVLGTDVVLVAVDNAQVACTDGRDLTARDIAPGATVSFVREGNGADLSSPPIIGGREMRVACDTP